MAARDEPLVTAFETRDSRNLHLQRSFIERCILGSSTIVRSRADRLGLRDLRHQLLGDGVAEGIEVLRDRDERAGAADEIDALEGMEVQAVVAISAATRKVRSARIMVTPYFTANSITRHSFDNDSSIDIVGERPGLRLRSLLGPVNLHTVDSSFGGRYRCRKLIKRIATGGTSGGVLTPLLEIKGLHTEFRTGAGVVRAV